MNNMAARFAEALVSSRFSRAIGGLMSNVYLFQVRFESFPTWDGLCSSTVSAVYSEVPIWR
jgi:hypothetical protein